MTKSILTCVVAVLFVTGCNSDGGSNNANKASGTQFEGTWLNAQVKPYLKSQKLSELCKVKEFNESKSEEFLDGVVIDAEGTMYDFRLGEESKMVAAKIKIDGSTTDFYLIKHNGQTKCGDRLCPKIHSLTVTKPSESTLNLNYGYILDDGSFKEGAVEYVRVLKDQLSKLKDDAAKCK